ncbi:MAG: ABC transporter substrate-binding protein [Phycisphaerae bacterium]
MLRRRLLATVLIAAGLLVACDRTSSDSPPAATRPAPRLTTRPAASTAPAALEFRDWVRDPAVHPDEEDSPPMRIVSAAPSITEIACALGLRAYIVGRTRFCLYPPEVLDVPSIGALVDVNVEAVLALRPDLVLISGPSQALTERLKPLGLRLESVPDESLEDLFVAIGRIGEWTGRPRTARRLIQQVRSELDEATRRCRGETSPAVLMVTGTLADPPTPPFVAGPRSFYDDLLRRMGARNAAAAGRAFGPLSLEYIVNADPDVIVELDPDGSARAGGDADARRVWAKVGVLRAVRTQRVHVLTGPLYYLNSPRVATVYWELCRAVHRAAP